MMRVPQAALALFSINLSYLLNGGVPLQAALKLLKRSESCLNLRRFIDDTSQSVQAGHMLSTAMRSRSKVFSDVSIALVEAAERDGTLGNSFRDIANLINAEAASRDRLLGAMAYPLMLGIAVLITLVFMIAYLTPAIKPLLLSIGVRPSLTTQVLFWLASEGAFVAGLLALLPTLLGAFFFIAKFNRAVRFYWHRNLLLVWILGDVNRDVIYARLCRIVARLLDSGSDIDKALAIASNSIDNLFIKDELKSLRLQMQAGNRFSQALVVLTTAPMILEPLMSSAESSGEVAPALYGAAEQLDAQASARLSRFTTLVPPFLVCTLGFVLLALVAGLLGPVFSSAITMGVTL